MPEMTITYIQKNGSTHLGNEVVQTDHLPRVGELIYNKTKFERTGGDGYVICVAYEVLDGKIKHHIIAREGHYVDPEVENFNHYDMLRSIDFEE